MKCYLGRRPKISAFSNVRCSNSLETGRELTQVDEPLYTGLITFIFELEVYPEPKALSSTDLDTLYQKLGTNKMVADLIGSSTNFVRANRTPNKAKGGKNE